MSPVSLMPLCKTFVALVMMVSQQISRDTLPSSVSQLTIDFLASSASAPMVEPDMAVLKAEDVIQCEAPPQASEAASWLDQSALAHSNKWHGDHVCVAPLGYETENDAIVFGPQAMGLNSNELLPSPAANDLDAILAVPSNGALSPIFQPKPPSTYNFQETTFARRIFRAVVETAYDVLSNPAKRPSDYERIFRLVLKTADPKKVAAMQRKMLSKGHYEELDNWNAPILHPGGAGTHYARRDIFGNLQPERTIAQPDDICMQVSDSLDSIVHRMQVSEPVVRVPGFEGEWLDPYDVQGYLEEKCIFIDASASFVEAEIADEAQISRRPAEDSCGYMPDVSSDRPSVGATSTPLDYGQLALLKQIKADLNRWNEFGGFGLCGTQQDPWTTNQTTQDYLAAADSDGYDSWHDMSIGQLQDPVTSDFRSWDYASLPIQQSRGKNVVIDVTKFVQGERSSFDREIKSILTRRSSGCIGSLLGSHSWV